MKHGTPYTQCPRCGNTTRLPVITCSKCFYDATPPPVSAPLLGYMAIILVAAVLVGALAWQRYKTEPAPFLGKWTGQKATFHFLEDGTLNADAYFDPVGKFHPVHKVLKQRWSGLVGDQMMVERVSTDGRNQKSSVRVQWTLGSSGKTLTLKGIGPTDNFASTVTLRKSSMP
jgi:hypothetical protein